MLNDQASVQTQVLKISQRFISNVTISLTQPSDYSRSLNVLSN